MTKRSTPTKPPSDTAREPITPVRTPPLDDAQREARYDGPDAIIALREYDADREYELSLDINSYRLGGSRSCEVYVPGRGLSAVHCLLERRGTRFLLHDQRSTHGTSREGRKIDVADLYPGDCFTATPVTFVALNREMRMQRPLLVELLGTDFAPWSPDKLMIEAAKGLGNLLITGEAGCEQGRLAHAIHAMSLRRARSPVECAKPPADRASQVALLRRAGKSTLMLTLDDKTRPLDPTFCSMLFSPGYHVRVIVLAPTSGTARRVLPDENVDQMQHVWIRPIGVRADELPEILDRLLVERDAPIRLAALTSKNREALLAHAWRGNWEELRTAADRLTAIARISSWDLMDWRERAAAIGLAKSTLYDWYKALKLTKPLLA
jgi:hypothetical protein